jgi:hypothetical protein
LAEALRGTLAYGWLWSGAGPVDLDRDPLNGWLQLRPDGVLQYEVLPDDPFGDEPVAPIAIALSTPHGAAVLLDLSPRVGQNLQFGGSSASVHRYQATTLLFGVELDELRTSKLSSVALHFAGFGGWAGLDILETKTKTDADGLVQSATLELKPSRTHTLPKALPGSLDLQIVGHWTTAKQDQGELAVRTALEVRARGRTHKEADTLLAPLAHIQDLLALMHGGFVSAVAAPVGVPSPRTERPLLWSRRCMHKGGAAIELQNDAHPFLSLADIGGPAALARWTRLCIAHPLVTGAITAVFREGAESTHTRLLGVGVGVERWVAAHRRTAQWAAKAKSPTPAHALARRVGGPFATWVGDPNKWAREFHDTYNAVKHHTGRQEDPELAYLIAFAARWLLIAALLDRISLSKGPSRILFGGYRLSGIGEALRSTLGT